MFESANGGADADKTREVDYYLLETCNTRRRRENGAAPKGFWGTSKNAFWGQHDNAFWGRHENAFWGNSKKK